MVHADANLVTFAHGSTTGHLAASADADAVAEFDLRRGLRLSAEARARIEESFEARLADQPDGPTVTATFSASIGASTRLALAAQLGVNGLWAEACAAGEARVQVKGDVGVSGQHLFDSLAADAALPTGALVPALALLRECSVHAGVYAEAYFALRARARLMVGGSLIPREGSDEPSGFSIAYDYGYAYIWGAGISGYLDIDLPDAASVVTVVADAVIDEVVRLLPPDTPRQAETMLRMIVPMAAGSAIAVGRALGAPQPGETGTRPAGAGVAAAFLDELRVHGTIMVLNSILDVGMEKVSALINRALDSVGLPDELSDAGRQALADARHHLDALDQAKGLPDALPHLGALCDRFATFATSAAPHIEGLTDVASGLTVATASSGVFQLLLGDDPMPSFPAASAARIRARINKPGPDPLTAADLVTYIGLDLGLLGESPLSSVSWLADVAGCAAPDLIKLLWTLGDNTSAGDQTQLASHLLSGLVDQLTAYLRPFIARLPDGDLKDVATFIEPLLEVVEQALGPALAATTERDGARIRDELDALLTSMFGAIVVRCLNAVVRPYFGRARVQLTELADHVDRNDPAFSEFFRVANLVDVVFRISPAVVSASLREIAGVLDLAEDSAFDSAVELMTSFVLLPADGAERRAQLAKLAGTDEARVGDADLTEDLLDALFVKSTAFAVGMIPPSIRMSTLIAVDQGPLPLATLYGDAKQVAISTGKAIVALGGVVSTVGDIVGSLFEDGKITAGELRALGESLKTLIGAGADLAKDVIDLIKDLSWPVFLTTTGGLGAIPVIREQFDAFFDGADWLVDEAHRLLNQVTDALIEAMVAVAQDVGVLDAGEGEDMGRLGDAVRQRALGASGEEGLELLGGQVHLSHAELATMAANAAFADDEVRKAVRTFHEKAVDQATIAREAAALLRPNIEEAKAAKTAIEARLAAQQREAGFTFGVSIEGIDQKAPATAVTRFQVVITGAGLEFVDGAHPLVRVEVGGWPARIDPAGWRLDDIGTLRGWFTVVADPTLPAAHPLVAEGAVAIPPQQVPAQATGHPVLDALHQVIADQAARHGTDADPAHFLATPIEAGQPGLDVTDDMFLPPILATAAATRSQRFPGVLAVDRSALLGVAGVAEAERVSALPGTPGLAFVSTEETKTVDFVAELTELVASASSGSAFTDPRSITTRARPGYTTITAAVHAAPKDGQDQNSTPGNRAVPTWFVLAGRAEDEPPPPVNNATFLREDGVVPAGLASGQTAVVDVVMHNAGTTTWTPAAGYKLGAAEPLGSTYRDLPHDVAPNQGVTFRIPIAAPPVTGSVFEWQMVQDVPNTPDREWFGTKSTRHLIALLINGADWIGQKNVPAKIPRGNTATVTVTMTNNGTTTWTPEAGYSLGAIGYAFGSTRRPLTRAVPPRGSFDFTFAIGAPPTPSAFCWQMIQGAGWFGERSASVSISPDEPSACAGLRSAIAGLKAEIADLVEERKNAAPQDKGPITARIAVLQTELTKTEKQARDLGCRA